MFFYLISITCSSKWTAHQSNISSEVLDIFAPACKWKALIFFDVIALWVMFLAGKTEVKKHLDVPGQLEKKRVEFGYGTGEGSRDQSTLFYLN